MSKGRVKGKDLADRDVRIELIVSLVLPEGATRRQAKEYVTEAVRSWQPPYAEGDPMLDLDPDAVWVAFRTI